RIGAAIDEGGMEAAAVEYFEVPAGASRGLLTPERSLALARWLLEHRHLEAALVVARRHIRDFPDGPGLAEAHLIAGQALLETRKPTPAYQHFLAVLDIGADGATAAAARAGIASIDRLQKRQIGRPHAPRA